MSQIQSVRALRDALDRYIGAQQGMTRATSRLSGAQRALEAYRQALSPPIDGPDGHEDDLLAILEQAVEKAEQSLHSLRDRQSEAQQQVRACLRDIPWLLSPMSGDTPAVFEEPSHRPVSERASGGSEEPASPLESEDAPAAFEELVPPPASEGASELPGETAPRGPKTAETAGTADEGDGPSSDWAAILREEDDDELFQVRAAS